MSGSVNVSRKIIVHGDELYLVTGNPFDGYYAERVETTELVGKYKRSWQAVEACADHFKGEGGEAA